MARSRSRRRQQAIPFNPCDGSRGIPQPIVDLLNQEINAALADPAIKARLDELGAIAISGDTSQFGAMLAAETERWRKAVAMSDQKKEQ